MGSFGPFEAPRCNGSQCRRWATYIADVSGFGPVCPICMERWRNEGHWRTLAAVFPRLAQQLTSIPGILVIEFMYGDGRDEDCECGRCRREWADQGWICPRVWFRPLFGPHDPEVPLVSFGPHDPEI